DLLFRKALLHVRLLLRKRTLLDSGWPCLQGAGHRDAEQGALLRAWLDGHVLPEFAGRVLPVDTAVAQRCARLHVPDRRSERDALIAATAIVHGMTVVTRNVADFVETGVAILNPWD
ncbi:type II toxin-antitoxin system VapC family toxin, partial [Burkholderia cenocepacia]|uniref:type II toxin-antitoxin system VapC family toxin n=1 Tax=Burkholderia cenocepacia TaxID=95486 RepID=UPI001FC89333